MSNWECGVCGYVHKEGAPPEKCPICDAPAKMFTEVKEEAKKVAKADNEEASRQGTKPVDSAARRWRCTVCGYVHTGAEPPETCPVCDAPKTMFVEIDAEGKALTEVTAVEAEPVPDKEKEPQATTSLFDKFVKLTLRTHLHPMMVHFPNGILPVVVVFLGLSVFFNIVSLETAAYYNLIFVLAMLPLVLLTGFIEWQKRYRGARSAIFITKIACSLIILTLVNILVFWRLIDEGVVAEGSPSRLIYLGVAVATLGTAAFAGHLGGKLAFGSRKD